MLHERGRAELVLICNTLSRARQPRPDFWESRCKRYREHARDHHALPPEEARQSSPAIVTGCRHLSTIFVAVPPFIASSWRLQTSHRSSNCLTLNRFLAQRRSASGLERELPCSRNLRCIHGTMHHRMSYTNAENKAHVESRLHARSPFYPRNISLLLRRTASR